MVFCFRSLRVRGHGFRCSLLTATCPVGTEGEAEGGKTGARVTSPQAAKALLSSRSRYPVPPGRWRRGAGPSWETEGMG